MNASRTAFAWSTLITADILLLERFRPHWRRLWAGLRAPHAWVELRGADRVAVELSATLLWLLAAWVTVGLLVTLAGSMNHRAAPVAARLGAAMLPAVLQRLVIGAAGVSIVLAPAQAFAATPAAAPSPSPTATGSTATASTATGSIATASTATGSIAPAWPSDDGPPPRSTPAPPVTPSPVVVPTRPRPAVVAPSPPASPARGAVQPKAPAASPAPAVPAVTPVVAEVVTVQPGDSLWLIAARRLGPGATDKQIAQSWPRWYAANRSMVGADPALLKPGTQLSAPSAPSASPRPAASGTSAVEPGQ